MGTPVLHVHVGKIPVFGGEGETPPTEQDFEHSIMRGVLDCLKPHVYSSGPLQRGRKWEHPYKDTVWEVHFNETIEARSTRQGVANTGYITVHLGGRSVDVPAVMQPGRMPLSVVPVKCFNVPRELCKQGFMRVVLSCAGYNAAEVIVKEEYGGELPAALQSFHPTVLRSGVIICLVKPPPDDPHLSKLPAWFQDRNTRVPIFIDSHNNTLPRAGGLARLSQRAMPPASQPSPPARSLGERGPATRASAPTLAPAAALRHSQLAAAAALASPPPGRSPAGARSNSQPGAAPPIRLLRRPTEAAGPPAATPHQPQREAELDEHIRLRQDLIAASAVAAASAGIPSLDLARAPSRVRVGSEASPSATAPPGDGPAGAEPPDAPPGLARNAPGERTLPAVAAGRALLEQQGWQDGQALGRAGRRAAGLTQPLDAVADLSGRFHRGGLGHLPGPPGVPETVRSNPFFVLGEISPEGESQSPRAPLNRPLDHMVSESSHKPLPQGTLADSCLYWLDDVATGSRELVRDAFIEFHSRFQTGLWAEHDVGGYSPIPATFAFRNELRKVVREFGVEMDEDETELCHLLDNSTLPSGLRHSCNHFLENNKGGLFQDSRVRGDIVVDFLNASRPVQLHGYEGAKEGTPSTDFRKPLLKFAKAYVRDMVARDAVESGEAAGLSGPCSSSALPPSPPVQELDNGPEAMVESPVAATNPAHGLPGPPPARDGPAQEIENGPEAMVESPVAATSQGNGLLGATPDGDSPGDTEMPGSADGSAASGAAEPMPSASRNRSRKRRKGLKRTGSGSADPPLSRGSRGPGQGRALSAGRSKSLTRLGEGLGDAFSPSPSELNLRRSGRASMPPRDFWMSQPQPVSHPSAPPGGPQA